MVIEKLFTEEELGYQLCLVLDGAAYFSSVHPSQVWGDDWDDAPYEHNAGEPYQDENCKIIRLQFQGEWRCFEEPCSPYCNSPYSVEEINQDKIPWLRYADERGWLGVYPGDTLRHFLHFMKASPAELILPTDRVEALLEKLLTKP